ncbi:MAG: histidine phosphatase family protein [Planctomycetota bacterium]|jgi:broad specificity phosphatase PhoE
MMRRLVLARHAQVDPQYTGRFLGSTDVPLSEFGLRQAKALARSLQVDHSVPLFVSPLRRAGQTAESFDHDSRIDSDLREIDFGRWEGLSFDEIAASHQDGTPDRAGQIERWSNFDLDFSFPDGELLEAFVTRVAQAADRLASDASDTVVAVTHGGVIRAMMCHLLGLEPRNYLLFDVKPASVTTINLFDGRGVLTGLGDTCHLKGIR